VPTPTSATPRTGTARRLALGAVALGAVGIAVAYALAFAPPRVAAAGPWVMALAMPLLMVATTVLGAVRAGGRLGALAWPLALVLLLVSGGLVAALALPADAPGDALVLGLPRRAAVILVAVGLLPLLVLPIAYAATFDALTLSEDDLERVRAARRPPPAGPAGSA
jgi:hypothetical protein